MPHVRIRAVVATAAFVALLAHGQAKAACTVTTVGVAFGAYNPQSGTPDDGTGTISVRCLFIDPAPNVALGTGSSGTYAPRRMTNGPWTLNYNLYTTAARTIVWGNGAGGTQTVTLNAPTGFPFFTYTRTVYGRVPASQNVGAGTYNDTVVVTVTW
jgi:spore coat protein U-like protein